MAALPLKGRRLRAVLFALTAAAILAAAVYRSWIGAQVRTVVVLSTVEQTPVLRWFTAVVTAEPRVEETVVAGMPSTVVRPGEGDGPWPAVVFVNGATRDGRFHPQVKRLARGLARAGFLVVVPDLPGLALGEITPATADATARVGIETANRSDARGGRVALYGVSVGTSLALLAAETPELAPRLTVVGGEAPYTDLEKIVRLATTGAYDNGRYDADPYVDLAIARSLAASLPAGVDRIRLLTALEQIDDDDPDPLAGLSPDGLGPGARALVALLLNRDPERFDDLYAGLPEQLRTGVERLSPVLAADQLRAPVELASAPEDKYFPPEESRALAGAASRTTVNVTVTSTLDHAIPEPSLGDLGDLFRFDGFVVRFLHAARSG